VGESAELKSVVSISDVVNIQISVNSVGPTAAGFGEPLILAYHTHYTDRVREYSSLVSVAGDFAVTDPAYLAAAAVFAQTPSPPALKIGRRALPYTQTLSITCLSLIATDVYSFQLRSPGGSFVTITTPSTGVVATDASTLAGLINAATMTPVVSSDTSQPVVSLTGSPTIPVNLLIQITTGGVVGTAIFKWSSNGGTSYTTGVTTAASVSLAGTGLTANFAAGTYTLNNIYSSISALGFASAAAGVITLTMPLGKLVDLKPDYVHCSLADATADPGVATDLAAILAADTNWYGLLLDSQSPAEIQAAAAWAESNKKLAVYNCSDTAIANPASTTDVAYLLKQSAYARSALLFAQTQLLCYSAAAWMGRLFPTTAGSENWAFKTLAGIPADVMTDNQIHAVENKNASVYTTIFGLNLTQFGHQPSGQWIDITRGTDALQNDMQVGVLALQANTLKVPFTDAGIDMFRSVIMGSLKRFTDSGFLAASPPPFVSLPTAASVIGVNKSARTLPNVSFSATLAGAIDSLTINGVLSN
jgi:uncharacterized protein DUF3383